MADNDLIYRLLGVEHQAENMVRAAEQEAERRKSSARESAGKKFAEDVAEKSREMEHTYQECYEEIRKNRDRLLSEYSEKVKNSEIEIKRFELRVGQILREGII